MQSSSASSCVNTSLTRPLFQNATVHDALESVYERRKGWRTLSGGEIIWPPELEAALLEGLEVYKPNDSRETRILGRYPMRNQFISEYIFFKTGKLRNPKQISSRLQQLRDTCSSDSLMKLLKPCHPPPRRCPSQHNCNDSLSVWSSPLTPVNPSASLHLLDCHAAQSSRKVVYIDILPDNQPKSYQHCTNLTVRNHGADSIVRLSPHARPLRSINPTITLLSPSALSAYSLSTVYSAGVVVFSGTSQLSAAGPAPNRADGALLYSTMLVPEFWQRISESPDPTRYTIFQDIVQDGQESSSVFSAVYKFVYPPGTTSDVFTAPFMEPFDGDRLLHKSQVSLPVDCRPAHLDHNPDNYDPDFVAAEIETYGGFSDRRTWEACSRF